MDRKKYKSSNLLWSTIYEISKLQQLRFLVNEVLRIDGLTEHRDKAKTPLSTSLKLGWGAHRNTKGIFSLLDTP